MTPWLVSRPAFFSAVATPHFLRSFSASAIVPASSSARLHSMIPAPVFSRSSLMSSVALGISGVLVLVEVVVVHHEVLFGHHGQVRRHLFDLFVFQTALRELFTHHRGAGF